MDSFLGCAPTSSLRAPITAIAGFAQCREGSDECQPLLRKERVVEVASPDDPGVRERHGLHPKLGGASDLVRLRLIDVGVEIYQARQQIIFADAVIMLMRPVCVPPCHLQFRRNVRIHAEAARFVGHSVEPSHVLPRGFWVVLRIWCPSLNGSHHMPGGLQISEVSKRKAVPYHAESPNEQSRPVAVVVRNPGVALAATQRDWIKAVPQATLWHDPIIPHEIEVKEDWHYA